VGSIHLSRRKGTLSVYRMLIVDDEPMIRKGLIKLIEQSEVLTESIRSAENGVQALEMIKQKPPHFLFTDIRMPKMDGLSLCKDVSELFPNIQMVVVSGYSDFHYAQKALSFGVKDYLLKPITKKSVYEVLDKLISNLNSKGSASYFSYAKLDDLIKRMEEAIWSLHSEELNQLLDLLNYEYQAYQLPYDQQRDMLQDYFMILIGNLNTRDVFPFTAKLDLQDTDNGAEAFEQFETCVKHILSDLKQKRKGKVKDPVEEAKYYIENNLSKEVSLEEVAYFLGLNASYFSQLFKQTTNETFVQYRIKRRMEKAKKLLEIPHYRITDISYEIGYADHPHFTKTFKKYAGISPSEYRKKLGID
jgi:two-component system response regulator YesN